MPRPGVGNPNNKGGGRKSAYEERQDAIWHEDLWKNVQDIDGLIAKVKSRKYAARDIASLKILQGNERLLGRLMDKLVPSKIDITTLGEAMKTENLNNPEVDKIKTQYEEALRKLILK